ncbi:MAG: hypothetical protein LH469_10320, partial [Frankiaceae bacterium]|nr:hypothetical protein [Frankiaceae bacterium]
PPPPGPRAPLPPGARAAPPRAGPASPGDGAGDGAPAAVTVGEQVSVQLSGDGRTVTAAVLADTPPVAAGAEDVDRDGRAEVFVRTARGSSTTFLTPYRWDGTTFAPLLLAGQPVRLGIGGSATHGEGFSCTDAGRLVVRTALRQDTGAWDVSATTYEVRGHELAAADRTDDVGLAEDDPRVGGAYLVDCRSVGEGE